MNFTEKYKHTSDADIIASYKKSNDKNWVGILYNRYAHLVFGVALKYLKNNNDANDILIKIFEKLFTELLHRDIQQFKNWLFVITKNECLMQLRKTKHSALLEKDITQLKFELIQEELDTTTIKEDVLNHLQKAIDNLNAHQKKCIELFYFSDLSYEKIAAQTNYTLNEVKSHIQNGKRNLKQYLEKNERV